MHYLSMAHPPLFVIMQLWGYLDTCSYKMLYCAIANCYMERLML